MFSTSNLKRFNTGYKAHFKGQEENVSDGEARSDDPKKTEEIWDLLLWVITANLGIRLGARTALKEKEVSCFRRVWQEIWQTNGI